MPSTATCGCWRTSKRPLNVTREQPLQIYLQVYNLGLDEKTHKPSIAVRYQIEQEGKLLIDRPEESRELARASQQFTAIGSLPLEGLAPGVYTAKVKLTDKIKGQTVTPSEVFELR